eukprot:TRINITY_DN22481_c0_g1_i1.p1 TRINITY_DN22481_c0_g1~~TRINITY_DN22481_c0_g1_i1.p1  ORF type:complete len:200 (-),score=36.13 TRINITY_DN22481_c0_g1_i1:77-676(-)
MDLTPFSVKGLDGAYYIKNWLSEAESNTLVEAISKQPMLENWKLYHPGPLIDGHVSPIPWFQPIIQRLKDDNIIQTDPFQFNFNTYTPPNYCIMPHKDTQGSQVVILTLLSSAVLDFWYTDYPVYAAYLFQDDLGTPTARLLLEPLSLTILSGVAFFKHMHGIPPTPNFFVDKLRINNFPLTDLVMEEGDYVELEKKKK